MVQFFNLFSCSEACGVNDQGHKAVHVHRRGPVYKNKDNEDYNGQHGDVKCAKEDIAFHEASTQLVFGLGIIRQSKRSVMQGKLFFAVSTSTKI